MGDINFGDLDEEAAALKEQIGELRDEFSAFGKQVVDAGSSGSAALRDQTQQAGILGGSLGSITAAFQSQLTLHRLLRDAYRETKKALEELVSGAVEFGRVRDDLADPNAFNNLASSIKGAFSNALGIGGEGLFSQLKSLLSDVFDFVNSDTFVSAIGLIDEGISDAVLQARLFIKTLDPEQVLEVASAIGSIVSGIGAVIGPVLSGIVQGLADLSNILRSISAAFGQKLFGDDFPATAAAIARIAVVVGGLVIPVAAVAASFAAMPVSILVGLAAIASFAGGVFSIKDEATGVQLKFGQIRDIIANGIVFGLQGAVERFSSLVDQAKALGAAILGNDADEVRFLQSAQRHNDLAEELKAKYKELNKDIAANTESAQTFAEALAAATSQGTQKIVELINGKLPGLIANLKTQAKDDPVEVPVQLETPTFKSNQGGGVNPGIGDAITADVTKTFQSLTPIVQGFGGILADTIADALDPNRQGKKSLRKRFEDFFKSLPLLLLQALTGQTAQKSGSALGGAIGLAAGGQVRAGGLASLAHYVAPRGFSAGGPPAGLDSSDRVPIWAAVDEWVIRARSALMYGRDVMAAINAGAVDPSALRALVGGRFSAPTPRHGFATGGAVTTGAGAPASSTTVLPILPVDRRTAELVLSAGDGSAFIAAAAKNASALRTVLGLGR